MFRVALALCAVLLLCGPACKPTNQRDIEEIKTALGQLDKKLDALDQKIGGRVAAAAPSRPEEDFDKVYKIDVGASPVKGPNDAPVTLVEYSDFQCPFCARADPVLKEVEKKYGDKLRIVFKHFPLSFHPAAEPAAIASLAAQEQGKFWEFHDVLFKNNSSLDGSPESMERYAKEAGLDVSRFKKDIKDKHDAYEKRIQADMEQGSDVDVRGTPTLYLNGKKLDPRQRSVDAMSATIDSLLGKKS